MENWLTRAVDGIIPFRSTIIKINCTYITLEPCTLEKETDFPKHQWHVFPYACPNQIIFTEVSENAWHWQKVQNNFYLTSIAGYWLGIQPDLHIHTPNSKVHGANMGPIWGLQDPGRPHVGPMNFTISDNMWRNQIQIQSCCLTGLLHGTWGWLKDPG